MPEAELRACNELFPLIHKKSQEIKAILIFLSFLDFCPEAQGA